MVEKKTTKAAAATTKTATPKKACTRKTAKVAVDLSAENVGFKAGDVYQTLATAAQPLAIEEIAKTAKITNEEVLLGTGWLLKEGKVKNDEGKIALA